jgi:hypothetical protein
MASHRLSAAPSIRPSFIGGADRDRTGGLLVANQALSQLSYSPLTTVASFQLSVTSENYWKPTAGNRLLILVGLGRVELPTSPLSGVRSSHLSYRPGWLMINQNAINQNVPEPKSISAPCHCLASLRNPCSQQYWLGRDASTANQLRFANLISRSARQCFRIYFRGKG